MARLRQHSSSTSSSDSRRQYLAALRSISEGPGASERRYVFDLPVAGNVVEWVTGHQFLAFESDSQSIYSHWGQYQLLRDTCQLRCPICNPYDPTGEGPANCWGKTRAQLQDEVLLRRSDRHGGGDVCPKCGGAREEFVQDGLLQDYNTVLACIGMRSAKSATAGLFATYVDHVICAMAGFEQGALARKLGQVRGTTFDVAFVATTGKQAEATIFDYYTNFRSASPWFQRYVTTIKEMEQNQPDTGMKPWRYREVDLQISNELAGVQFSSLHSNSAGMAGRTRIAGFIDELARFDVTESKRGANEVWRVVSASLKTIRRAADVMRLPRCIFGVKIATSSPISIDDKMMTLLRDAEREDQDNVLAIHKATWDFNPFQPRSSFDEEFREDAVQAQRDFGAIPPLVETPFIEDVPRFAHSVEPELGPAVSFRTTYPEDSLGRQYVGVEVVDAIVSPEVPRFICFDAGESFDSFAGAMGHPAWVEVMPDPDEQDPRKRQPRRILMTIYDFVIRIMPTQQPKRTVWFDSVVKIIEALKPNFRIARVNFDRWNSTSLIQNIRTLGVPAEQERLVVDDFISFRGDAYGGKVKLLPPTDGELSFLSDGQVSLAVTPDKLTPAACGIYELVKLSRSEDLKRIFNPHKGEKRGHNSDDTAQVLVGVHKMIQKAYSDDPAKKGRKERLRREQFGGETWGGGGVVQAMRGWSTVQPTPRPGGGPPRPMPPTVRRRGGVPGYMPSDSYATMDGQPAGTQEGQATPEQQRAHNFEGRGVIRMRRW